MVLASMPDSVIIKYVEGYRVPDDEEVPLSRTLFEPAKTNYINAILQALGTGARLEVKLPEVVPEVDEEMDIQGEN
jgi:hypothetical protein